MDIGTKIMKLRKQNNMTQKQLASLLGISVSTMNRIELSKRPLLYFEINKLCDVFNVSSDYLLRNDSFEWYDYLTYDEVRKLHEIWRIIKS